MGELPWGGFFVVLNKKRAILQEIRMFDQPNIHTITTPEEAEEKRRCAREALLREKRQKCLQYNQSAP